MWFLSRSDTNQAAQSPKQARSLKFRILVEEEWYYPSSENKGADQLRSYCYCEADLRLCFRLCRLLVFPCGGSFIGSAEGPVQQTTSKPKTILFYNPLAYQLTRGILTKAKYFMENCEINNCIFEFDHKLVQSSDAVIFNSKRELDLHDKKPGQLWIMLQWESLQSHIQYAHPRAPVYQRDRVNWTMGYSKKADIYLPYGVARRLPQQKRPHRNYSQISNRKTKDAVWIVSHCETSSKREIYVNILKKYISVDILGKCGKK